MKKGMTLSTGSVKAQPRTFNRRKYSFSLKSACQKCRLLVSAARFFSCILEEKVSPWQTLHLLHALLAMILVLLPFHMPWMVRILLLIWFVTTLIQCRRNGLGTE